MPDSEIHPDVIDRVLKLAPTGEQLEEISNDLAFLRAQSELDEDDPIVAIKGPNGLTCGTNCQPADIEQFTRMLSWSEHRAYRRSELIA